MVYLEVCWCWWLLLVLVNAGYLPVIGHYLPVAILVQYRYRVLKKSCFPILSGVASADKTEPVQRRPTTAVRRGAAAALTSPH